jgi:hypothetical protein
MFLARIGLLTLAALPATAPAQSNTVPGRDLRLSDTWAIAAFQRTGSFPNGNNAIGTWTTVCNPGTSALPFEAAMDPDHAFIHYLVARESGGRLVQISNRGYVKHTFGSNNDPSACGTCAGPGRFSFVEVGCSDTYANSQAVDHFLLGPPDEVDPWLGTWVPQCSHFDRGEPPVGPGQACDGIRSLSHAQANVLNQTIHHQTAVRDAELLVAGASFYWQAGYLLPAEAESLRADNIASREFFPAWTGSDWSMVDGPVMLPGTILQRWSGAQIASNTNGADDGRYYVAVKVTGPTAGVWHYEYAVHNRDNARGLGGLRIPVCPDATVTGFGFHDVDGDPLNDWIGSKVGGEIVFATAANPLRWNTLFNFWFDCDAAPVAGVALSLDQAAIGPGAAVVAVSSSAPTGLFNQDLGPGCGNPAAPHLLATGSPPRALLGNATFGLRSEGNPPGALCAFVLSGAPGTTVLPPGCPLYAPSLAAIAGSFVTAASGAGAATMPLAIPAFASLEGVDLDFQAANLHTGGVFLGAFDLSNGLRVRVGSAIATCP